MQRYEMSELPAELLLVIGDDLIPLEIMRLAATSKHFWNHLRKVLTPMLNNFWESKTKLHYPEKHKLLLEEEKSRNRAYHPDAIYWFGHFAHTSRQRYNLYSFNLKTAIALFKENNFEDLLSLEKMMSSQVLNLVYAMHQINEYTKNPDPNLFSVTHLFHNPQPPKHLQKEAATALLDLLTNEKNDSLSVEMRHDLVLENSDLQLFYQLIKNELWAGWEASQRRVGFKS